MRIVPKNTVRKFQVGGTVETSELEEEEPTTQYATEEEGTITQPQTTQGQVQGQDPIAILAQAAMQALQNQDCNIAMQVCQGFIQLIQMAQQQSQAQSAHGSSQGEPVFRKGGILTRRIRK